MKHAKKIGVEAWNHDGERHNLLYREELEHPETVKETSWSSVSLIIVQLWGLNKQKQRALRSI